MKKTIYIILFIGSFAQAQTIESHYDVKFNENYLQFIRINNLKIINRETDKPAYQNRIDLFKGNSILDSLIYDDINVVSLNYNVDESNADKILYRSKDDNLLYEISVDGSKFRKQIINASDTLEFINQLYNYSFFKNIELNDRGITEYGQKLYKSVDQNLKLVFDFSLIPEIKTYARWAPVMPYVSNVYIIGQSNDQMLIETGIFDGGMTNLNYFVLNMKTEDIQNITDNDNFQLILKDPKENLTDHQDYKYLDFEPEIGKYFLSDVTDTLAYLSANFSEMGASWDQDAFVMNRNYQIIDRVLERNFIFVGYEIEDNVKWIRVRSVTDTTTVDFNLQLEYLLEKAFYDIYYNRSLKVNDIVKLDKYELSLLKNFIFAKHNYAFNSPFYQSYYNTFTFYNSEVMKKSRTKKVNDKLTDIDKENLEMINEALKKYD